MTASETSEAKAAFDFAPWLDPDETLVWQGAPATAPKKPLAKGLVAVLGWAFALAVTYALATSGLGLIDKSDGWLDYRVGFGAAIAIGGVVPLYAAVAITRSELERLHRQDFERYALTEKRALAAYSVKEQYLVKSIPIGAADWIGSSFGPKGRIVFSRLGLELSDGGELVPEEQIVEFRDIPDAPQVYRLIRDIQNRMAA